MRLMLSVELQLWAQPGFTYGTSTTGELLCANKLLNVYASTGKMERAQHLLLCLIIGRDLIKGK
jgi:hypothetical protein